MSPRPQNTIARPVKFSGKSLFHGFDSTVQLRPADEGSGIVFRRTDLADSPDIPVCCENIAKVPRRTVVGVSDECRVETVEHLMAALAGLQIDNCLVEINAPEVPAYDGSCRDFCDGILEAGVQGQVQPVHFFVATSTVTVSNPDAGQTITLAPCKSTIPKITYTLDYGVDAPISPQTTSAEMTADWFYHHISAARTFVLEKEIKGLQQAGYGLHLTARDIVVLGENGVIDNELRWPDEGVRHKILDCIGDLALSGVSFRGDIEACRSGHHLNHEMARKLTNIAVRASSTEQRAA